MTPICKFNDVAERDMDFLFLEEFVLSQEFLSVFTSKINKKDAIVVEVEHSKYHPEFGESDMTVIVEAEGERHGLLIENKIDAIAMPQQCNRYYKRGDFGIENGDYSSYDVFIIAPEKYLSENIEAQKYPNKVSYEECLKYFEKKTDSRASFKLAQINQAIHKQKTGYQVIEDKAVTDFWHKYISYQQSKFPHLYLTATEGPRGSNSIWPQFNTTIKGLYIIHKSSIRNLNIGYVDLTFPNMAEKLLDLELLLNKTTNFKNTEMSIHPTGKSAAVRLTVPMLDFKDSFEKQLSNVEKCFIAIEILTEYVKTIDINELKSIMQE